MKSVFASKTMWFNAAVAAVIAFWGVIAPLLPISASEAASIAVIGNMILRYITTGPVSVTGN